LSIFFFPPLFADAFSPRTAAVLILGISLTAHRTSCLAIKCCPLLGVFFLQYPLNILFSLPNAPDETVPCYPSVFLLLKAAPFQPPLSRTQSRTSPSVATDWFRGLCLSRGMAKHPPPPWETRLLLSLIDSPGLLGLRRSSPLQTLSMPLSFQNIAFLSSPSWTRLVRPMSQRKQSFPHPIDQQSAFPQIP